MTRKLFRVSMVAIVGCAFVMPQFGCDSGGTPSDKPTIDMTTPLKTPDAPAGQKVETTKKAR
jgi:hypothetical protein